MTATTQPDFRAFTVIKREGQDDFWLPIGAAFAHQSGDGFNVILQALPIPNGDGQCKIVLRPPKADDGRGEGSAAGNVTRIENKNRKRDR
jgi:hypothetical protein